MSTCVSASHFVSLSVTFLFCFSVVFVEPGQSAARAGLRSGDYVVRMGAENVVLMDQSAGLELLQ